VFFTSATVAGWTIKPVAGEEHLATSVGENDVKLQLTDPMPMFVFRSSLFVFGI
jgi:hypothetical protein